MVAFEEILRDFNSILGTKFSPSETLEGEARRFIAATMRPSTYSYERLRDVMLTAACRIIGLHKDQQAKFFACAASEKLILNFHQKALVRAAFDSRSVDDARRALADVDGDAARKERLLQCFEAHSDDVVLSAIRDSITAPINKRTKKVDERLSNAFLEALFGHVVFTLVPTREAHSFFDPFPQDDYLESFWQRLHRSSAKLFSRDYALEIIVADAQVPFADLRRSLLTATQSSYLAINNHGTLAVIIAPYIENGINRSWELAGDITIFAEKHIEEKLDKAYFRRDVVARVTSRYIGIDEVEGKFDIACGGFSYEDCFTFWLDGDVSEHPHLLLVFRKHQRDETLIPCPTCRSHNVQGNSYPSLGIKSWECCNPLCPDRSHSNRGKRYSFSSLLAQEAIKDERNAVPPGVVKRWNRDVVTGVSVEQAIEMCVLHYSLAGDTVVIRGTHLEAVSAHRTFKFAELTRGDEKAVKFFHVSPWFSRYVHENRSEGVGATQRYSVGDQTVEQGDALQVLRSYPVDFFDGAVTSPPYYNAREYAQWDNIYCHMYDMFNIAREVYRVLRPGSLYLYNVFDYFDNENTVALSAMGQKRMTLSAFTIDAFRRAGFAVCGNIVWDKGEIEGKRGFNGGNFSPYYQSPFNCWEHIIVFSKGTPAASILSKLPTLLRAQPVIKMVRGKNTYGHTAPFPVAIPDLLAKNLPSGAVILDPFGGSCTTAVAAQRRGIASVCIERDPDYAALGVKRIAAEQQEARQLSLV